MLLDSTVFTNRGPGYPSYGSSWQSTSGDKTPPLSDASTTDSRGAIPLDHFRADYGTEYVDSSYYMQPRDVERAQMAAINYYMQAAYGQQMYGNQPPTPGAHPNYADAPRGAEAARSAESGQPAGPRAQFVQGPGAPQVQFIPQFMQAPMHVPFQVPPGYMLVPLDQNEADAAPPRSGPPQSNKNCLEHGISRGSRAVSRSRPKAQRSTGQKVSKIFVGGLSPVSTVETLREHFGKYGEIVDVAVILEPTTRKSRGFGYVEFADGIPEGLLDIEHYVDSRRCGVRAYEYNPEDKP